MDRGNVRQSHDQPIVIALGGHALDIKALGNHLPGDSRLVSTLTRSEVAADATRGCPATC